MGGYPIAGGVICLSLNPDMDQQFGEQLFTPVDKYVDKLVGGFTCYPVIGFR